MAAGGGTEFLVDAALYLGATAVAVPLFRKLKLGTILGYLGAGVLLGPSALNLLYNGDGVFAIAELGVVLFLFVIGLELSLSRLWSLRHTIFGLGLMQLLVTGTAIGWVIDYIDVLSTGPAYIVGFGLACSSTAFALSLLEERHELNTPHGTKAFSVLLLQDVAVIPLFAAIPFVATQGDNAADGLPIDWQAIGLAAGAIAAIVFLSHFVLDRVLRLVAISGSREAFTAAALLIVAVTALIVDAAGLSMALGAFLAGVLLAESTFRHQIESDIEPFRELLLGLFFIGVGMQLDLAVLRNAWVVVLFGAAALIVFKAAVIFVLARILKSATPTALKTAAVLSQGGEFGFVVFSLSVGEGLLTSADATMFSAIVTLSMMATPLIMMAVSKLEHNPSGAAIPVTDMEDHGSVLIVGFGRMGQLVNQVLRSSNVKTICIDNSPRRIEVASRFGNKVYFGNGTDVHLLFQAGALDVDAIVFTLNAKEKLKPVVQAVRERCPKVRILARVYDRLHEIEMMDVKADFVVREMYESSMALAGETLAGLGFSEQLIADIMAEYRERDRDRLLAQKAEGIYAKKDVLSKPFEAVEQELS
ncbi:putative potassium-efflux protein [Parvularcula bermudensis HTCC2503]|uniref:Putative potassium-efflux protein n=1 Tax=Parvularcula bermudensis (strain ATCC BAA-594 / HTCC2503 / KCTC 12087) TaxID=314260 RepID=E0TG57_PARBH|nr:monovalent cation:proton antiporter-2 (CPA2) family protein [Parvularcula bermudensis]ADM10628.1 putative potassium-efflux protein [Parvularcula bermudensis HTCC2503]